MLRGGGRLALYVSDRASMVAWKFAGEDSHRLYDPNELLKMALDGGFLGQHVQLLPVRLPFGLSGTIMTADKIN